MVFELNQSLFLKIFSFSGNNVFLDKIGIFLADWVVWFIMAWVLVRLFFSKNKDFFKESFFILGVGALSWVVAALVQQSLAFPRPIDQLGIEPLISHRQAGSFPSGHTTLIFASLFFYFFRSRQFSWPIFTLALFTGLARIYTGAHFPLDIVGGVILGGLVAYLAHLFLSKIITNPPNLD